MPVLKNWTSRETFSSRGRLLGLLHPAGGLLIAATTTRPCGGFLQMACRRTSVIADSASDSGTASSPLASSESARQAWLSQRRACRRLRDQK